MPTSRFSYNFDTPTFKGISEFDARLFIDGQFVDPSEEGTHVVINPVNGQTIAHIPVGSAKDVDIAVQAARRAYATTWGLHISGAARGRMLNKLADLMENNVDELAALEALNLGHYVFPILFQALTFGRLSGKPYLFAKQFDFVAAINTIRYYAGFADKIGGKTIHSSPEKMCYTMHEPIGVVGQIIPWNAPFILAWKLAPALATGNTVILKPSEITPLTAIRVASLMNEAGFPPGVVNIVNGVGSTVGQAICEHRQIFKVSFTGSALTGRKIMEAAARSNLKSLSLELGGKSPTIIFDDANLDQAVKWTAHGILSENANIVCFSFNTGQACSAGTRIFVQEAIFDRFIQKLKEQAEALTVGDPFEQSTTFGPQVSEMQFKRVMGYIASGKEAGAHVQCGGESYNQGGFYVKPTIFTECSVDMEIAREEIFGPVGVVFKFKDEAEVIAKANDSMYGLACSVFTKDIQRAMNTAHKIEAGTTWVNFTNFPDHTVPFGGYKMSGFGRDLGEYALSNYTQVKAVHFNLGLDL
ncbi:hypothetical protein D9757_009570 [Collybiopsis confluens]|uniref:Aldehyde dehydrogenase domain-containing protein n=1 Tax=Collybiopsis confluens TaxID=2823264 RepID=A0A8H5G7Y4_9AGAR|nr:hypothetical protein D9757_012238 [Collybiopsis confluens]KAF5376606.1 hypothetical protein D9757_009570 [Collybiopsis confluens]